jgi:hypothetical protein
MNPSWDLCNRATELPKRVAEADISDLLPFNFPKTPTAI